MEKSYVEIKVSFIHIVVLLAGVLVIGVFLFYLGYQAGKSSARTEFQTSDKSQLAAKSEELKLSDDSEKTQKKETPKQQEDSISDEMRLHQLPTSSTASTSTPTETTPPKVVTKKEVVVKNVQPEPKDKEKISSKPVKKELYFVIQVGAFADYSNAQKYSTKFAKMGYPTEINTVEKKGKKIFRVWVGNFASRDIAQRDRDKLQKEENGKFSVVNTGSE